MNVSHESAANIGHHSDFQQWTKNRRPGRFGPLARKRGVRISRHRRRLDRRHPEHIYARRVSKKQVLIYPVLNEPELGQPGDYKKAYSNEGVEIIARIYRDNIERFGYDF